MSDARQAHWDQVYGSKAIDEVSWYQRTPEKSLALVRDTGAASGDPIIDVGGGASYLVDELLTAGFQDVTVLDISAEVLGALRRRLGARAAMVSLLQADV